ncbi:MAG: DNA topoisomerase IB [Candidatus Dormibacteria bacterium]
MPDDRSPGAGQELGSATLVDSRIRAAEQLAGLLESHLAPPLQVTEALSDPVASARAAGLRYVSDLKPGITRHRAGRSFSYRYPDGAPVTDRPTLRRVKRLAIPPAYSDVWICPDPNGHLQAVGRDARGRKQYRYHQDWRTVRDSVKFHRMLAFGEALPTIRERTDRDLRRRGLPREKVLATVVQMLERTRIRIGNEEYSRQNNSYGLTTLRNRHVKLRRGGARFRFMGKSGKEHDVVLEDPRLVRVVKQCMDIPGQELFQYLDEDGNPHSIDSADVNDYIREISGHEFTAKDFRTWAGTVLAARYLRAVQESVVERDLRSEITRCVRAVAEALRNTPAVCRRSYIHPSVIEAFTSGLLNVVPAVDPATLTPTMMFVSAEEKALLEMLRQAGGKAQAA